MDKMLKEPFKRKLKILKKIGSTFSLKKIIKFKELPNRTNKTIRNLNKNKQNIENHLINQILPEPLLLRWILRVNKVKKKSKISIKFIKLNQNNLKRNKPTTKPLNKVLSIQSGKLKDKLEKQYNIS